MNPRISSGPAGFVTSTVPHGVFESPDGLGQTIELLVPGIRKESLNIKLFGKRLVVAYTPTVQETTFLQSRTYYVLSRDMYSNGFTYEAEFSDEFDLMEITANLQDGILTIEVLYTGDYLQSIANNDQEQSLPYQVIAIGGNRV